MKKIKKYGNIDPETEMTDLEKQLLDRAGRNDTDDVNLSLSELEHTDKDGDMLNEGSSVSAMAGSDLDVPGAELDDANEAIGEEDEENNSYSQADTA